MLFTGKNMTFGWLYSFQRRNFNPGGKYLTLLTPQLNNKRKIFATHTKSRSQILDAEPVPRKIIRKRRTVSVWATWPRHVTRVGTLFMCLVPPPLPSAEDRWKRSRDWNIFITMACCVAYFETNGGLINCPKYFLRSNYGECWGNSSWDIVMINGIFLHSRLLPRQLDILELITVSDSNSASYFVFCYKHFAE